jgi:DNA-binding Xre family transcriptional regulator
MNCTTKNQIFILLDSLQINKCTLIKSRKAIVKWNWKRALINAKLTQTKVAELLGWQQSYLNRLISGTSEIKMDDVKKLCELLNVTPEEIFLD